MIGASATTLGHSDSDRAHSLARRLLSHGRGADLRSPPPLPPEWSPSMGMSRNQAGAFEGGEEDRLAEETDNSRSLQTGHRSRISTPCPTRRTVSEVSAALRNAGVGGPPWHASLRFEVRVRRPRSRPGHPATRWEAFSRWRKGRPAAWRRTPPSDPVPAAGSGNGIIRRWLASWVACPIPPLDRPRSGLRWRDIPSGNGPRPSLLPGHPGASRGWRQAKEAVGKAVNSQAEALAPGPSQPKRIRAQGGPARGSFPPRFGPPARRPALKEAVGPLGHEGLRRDPSLTVVGRRPSERDGFPGSAKRIFWRPPLLPYSRGFPKGEIALGSREA